MTKKDKWILGVTCGAVAMVLVSALIYAGIENIRASNARIAREEADEQELRRVAQQKREAGRLAEKARFQAWSQTAEGKEKLAKRQEQTERLREQQAQADKIIRELAWKPWREMAKAFQEMGFNTLPSTEPKAIRVEVPFDVAVRLSNYEIATICKMAYQRLGDGAFVLMQDPAGTRIGQADGWSAKGYK